MARRKRRKRIFLYFCIIIIAIAVLTDYYPHITKDLFGITANVPSSQKPLHTESPGSFDQITVASFNVQTFGQKKMSDPLILHTLPIIIRRYDLIAIEEVRDATGTAIQELHNLVPDYDLYISPRLGRTQSKEQYALFARGIQVSHTQVYPDPEDVFEREPYIVYINTSMHSFSLIITHVKPSDALEEIASFADVIEYVQEYYHDPDFMIVGDLNADCSYYDEESPPLKNYTWIINNTQDTTVSHNTCTYDRIITNMGTIQGDIFRFDQEYNLTFDQTKSISDHYPVWVTI